MIIEIIMQQNLNSKIFPNPRPGQINEIIDNTSTGNQIYICSLLIPYIINHHIYLHCLTYTQ